MRFTAHSEVVVAVVTALQGQPGARTAWAISHAAWGVAQSYKKNRVRIDPKMMSKNVVEAAIQMVGRKVRVCVERELVGVIA